MTRPCHKDADRFLSLCLAPYWRIDSSEQNSVVSSKLLGRRRLFSPGDELTLIGIAFAEKGRVLRHSEATEPSLFFMTADLVAASCLMGGGGGTIERPVSLQGNENVCSLLRFI